MNKKIFFIYNPVSGKGKINRNITDVVGEWIDAEYQVEIRPTRCANDATEVIKNLDLCQYDRVICSGGDGTLDEVVAGMITHEELERLPIGYLPAGSTNDFANSLNIPTETLAAAQNAINGESFKCDVGKLGDKPFVYVAAFGAFTEVSYATNQQLKNALGHFAYILKGAGSLADIKPRRLEIIANNKHYDGKYILGMITNTKSVGGFRGIIGSNRVEFDDGEFEVTLIKKPRTPLGLNSIVGYLLGSLPSSKYVETMSVKNIRVRTKDGQEMSWTVDGEYGGSYKDVKVLNMSKAMTIVVPEKE